MGLPKIAVPEYSLKLPSNGKEIKYRPFLVKEEKILLMAMESENEDEITAATKNVITNCVYGDIDIEDLAIFDIEYIFLWLRAKAKGEQIEINYKCPTCTAEIPASINVMDIKVQTKKGHSTKIEVTDSLGLVMKYPNLKIQNEIQKLNSNDEINDVIQLFETVRLCIDYIYDAEKMYSSKDHTSQEMSDFLESLTDDQFQKIAEFFETAPKLKHIIKLVCNNPTGTKGKKKTVCGYKEDVVLEGLQSFFD
jgi:hypothetical protein